MKKLLLTLFIAFLSLTGATAKDFEWGTATWNIQDGWVFENFEDYNQEGVVLSYPNPANYSLTFLNIIAINYDVYVDGAEEPVEGFSSRQAGTDIRLSFDFLEGHSYKVVTKEAILVQANLATYVTDTLSINNTDSYSISFSIKGPELVKTIDVEQRMSLAIIDQDNPLTFSELDANSIFSLLGISSADEAMVIGLQANGAYVTKDWYGPGYFDGWRDADGDYTLWGGGYNNWAKHNAYPAVYSIKLNETCDTVKYYFYDYWRIYDPSEDGEIPAYGQAKQRIRGFAGSSVADGSLQGQISRLVIVPNSSYLGEGTTMHLRGTGNDNLNLSSPRKAPDTHFNRIVWDWDDGEGNITKYTRSFRCDEGSDYKASFIIKANNKYVLINATMHFVSVEDYNNPPEPPKKKGDVNGDGDVNISDVVAIINQMAGTATWLDANVNGDDKVDISDVVSVINIMAGSSSEE